MLTKLTTRNFKRFGCAEIELGNPVIFIGPNDSVATAAARSPGPRSLPIVTDKAAL